MKKLKVCVIACRKVMKIIIYLPPLFRSIQRCLFTVFLHTFHVFVQILKKMLKSRFYMKKSAMTQIHSDKKSLDQTDIST